MPIDVKKSEMGDVVKDFYKSDAPQFKGKSKEKRREMAIAAKLSAQEESTDLKEKSLLPFKDLRKKIKNKKSAEKAGKMSNKFIARAVTSKDDDKAERNTDAGRRATRLKYKLQKVADKGRRKLPEELELDELNRSTLSSYVKKAEKQIDPENPKSDSNPKHGQRASGVRRAYDSMTAKDKDKGLKRIRGQSIGIGTYVELMSGKYAQISGFTSSSSTAGPRGKSAPMPAGKVVSFQAKPVDSSGRVKGSTQKIQYKDIKRVVSKQSMREATELEEAHDPSDIQKKLKANSVYKAVAKLDSTDVFYANKKVGSISHKTGKVTAKDPSHKAEITKALNESLEEATANSNPKLAAQLAARKAQRERMAQRAKNKKEKPVKKASTTTTSNANRVSSNKNDEDKNIVMQLRKAQDVGGNFDIKFRRGQEKLDKNTINTLLKIHDSLKKPDSKRMFRVAVVQSPQAAKSLAKKMQGKV